MCLIFDVIIVVKIHKFILKSCSLTLLINHEYISRILEKISQSLTENRLKDYFNMLWWNKNYFVS